MTPELRIAEERAHCYRVRIRVRVVDQPDEVFAPVITALSPRAAARVALRLFRDDPFAEPTREARAIVNRPPVIKTVEAIAVHRLHSYRDMHLGDPHDRLHRIQTHRSHGCRGLEA